MASSRDSVDSIFTHVYPLVCFYMRSSWQLLRLKTKLFWYVHDVTGILTGNHGNTVYLRRNSNKHGCLALCVSVVQCLTDGRDGCLVTRYTLHDGSDRKLVTINGEHPLPEIPANTHGITTFNLFHNKQTWGQLQMHSEMTTQMPLFYSPLL